MPWIGFRCFFSPGRQLLFEIKEVINRDLKRVRNMEQGVKGNGSRDIGSLDVAQMRPAYIDELGKLHLRQSPEFAVIGNVQSKFRTTFRMIQYFFFIVLLIPSDIRILYIKFTHTKNNIICTIDLKRK